MTFAQVRRAHGRGVELRGGPLGVAGQLEEVRSDRVQAVVLAEPVQRPSSSASPALGPSTMAAAARLSDTIGLPVICSSPP